MKIIHKIAAVVIENNKLLMVRKKGHDTWTCLGGRPEEGETEEQTLLREIKEEADCKATILKKLGDFTAPAADNPDAMVKLSAYTVTLHGDIHMIDPELEEYAYIDKQYAAKGIKLTAVLKEQLLPYCKQHRLLDW